MMIVSIVINTSNRLKYANHIHVCWNSIGKNRTTLLMHIMLNQYKLHQMIIIAFHGFGNLKGYTMIFVFYISHSFFSFIECVDRSTWFEGFNHVIFLIHLDSNWTHSNFIIVMILFENIDPILFISFANVFSHISSLCMFESGSVLDTCVAWYYQAPCCPSDRHDKRHRT